MTSVIACLPESGMLVQFKGTMGLNPDWSANEETHTSPDVLVEWTPDDFVRYVKAQVNGMLAGPDPEVDPVLRECLRLASPAFPQ